MAAAPTPVRSHPVGASLYVRPQADAGRSEQVDCGPRAHRIVPVVSAARRSPPSTPTPIFVAREWRGAGPRSSPAPVSRAPAFAETMTVAGRAAGAGAIRGGAAGGAETGGAAAAGVAT